MIATSVTVIAVATGGGYSAPIANPDVATTYKTSPINIFPIANDVDPKNGYMTLSNVQSPTFGSVKIYQSRYITYTPQSYWAGTLVMNYTITNTKLTATSNITVLVRNHVPDPVNFQYTISKNSQNNVINVFTDTGVNGNKVEDVDNDLMFVTKLLTNPSNGVATISSDGQKIFYTPNTGFTQTDTFNYQISDYNDTASGSITFKVSNDPPTAVPDTFYKPQNLICTLDVLANDYDINGDPITITEIINSGVGKGIVSADNLFVSYVPVFGVYTDSFEYTIADNGGLTSTTYVVISMTNTPPKANDTTITISKNSFNKTIPLDYMDPDPMTQLFVTLNTQPSKGTTYFPAPVQKSEQTSIIPGNDAWIYWTSNTYTLLYTPLYGDIGSYSYQYTVSDGIATATATVTVIVINDPPVANDDMINATKNNPFTFNPLTNDYDPNNDLIQIKLPSQTTVLFTNKGGNLTYVTNSTVMYNPPRNYVGPDWVVYTIEDVQNNPSNNLPATANISIQVVASPPTAVADTYTLNKKISSNLDVLVNDFSVSGDSFNITSVSTSRYGSTLSIVVVNGKAYIRYQAIDYVSPSGDSDYFTYTITDSNGLTSTAGVNVVLINTAPVALNDFVSIQWNTSTVVSVLNNDTDINNDVLTVNTVSAATSGSPVNQLTTIKYTPNLGFVGTDSFTYKCNDGLVDSNTATVQVVVINNPPTAVDDSYEVLWGKTTIFDVISNDFDVDGNSINIISTNYNNLDGTVTITNDNKIQFNQTSNKVGTITFTYTITDWNKQSTATVTVKTYNIPPVAVNDYYSFFFAFNGNPLLDILSNDNLNSFPVTISSISTPNMGSASIQGQQIQFINTRGIGTATFTYTIVNGGSTNNTSTATITIDLTDTTFPVASPIAVTVHWRTYLTGTTLFPQPSQFTSSGQQIDVYLGTPNNGGSAVVVGTTIQTVLYKQKQFYNPWNNVFLGTEIIPFTLGDGGVNTSSTMSVTTYNTNPTSSPIQITQLNAGTMNIDVVSYCSDLDSLDSSNLQLVSVYNLTETPTSTGTISISNGKAVFNPNTGWAGTATFNYIVTDGLANTTNTITISLKLNSASNKFYTLHWSPNPIQNTYNVTQNITDGVGNQLYLSDPFVIEQNPLPASTLAVDTTYGTNSTRTNVKYKIPANYTGTDSFIVQYSISNLPISVFITITNTAPVAQKVYATTKWNKPQGILLAGSCTDPDSDPTILTSVGAVSPANSGTATLYSTGQVKFIPSTYIGNVTFSYTCSDGLATSTNFIQVTVTNNAPTANNINITKHWRDHLKPYILNITSLSGAADIDGDSVTLSSIGPVTISVTNAVTASIVTVGGSKVVNITANANSFIGTFTFQYTITDGVIGVVKLATINIYDNPPVAVNDYYTINGSNPQVVTSLAVLSNDIEIDSLDSKSIVSNSKSFPFTSQIQYTAPAAVGGVGFIGTDSFTYTITDGALTSTATVYVTVTSQNPVANPDTITVTWSATSSITDITKNDVRFNSFTAITSQPSFGTVVDSNPQKGNVTYKANTFIPWNTFGRIQNATDTFQYSIKSDYGLSATGIVTVIVTNVIPLAVADNYTFAISNNPQPVQLDVLTNDNSGDSDAITINNNLINYGSQSVLTRSSTFLTYTPKLGFYGTEIFSYQISDGQTSSSYANITITITPPAFSCLSKNYNISKGDGFSLDLSTLVSSSGGFSVTYSLSSSNSYTRGVATLSGTTFSYQTVARRSTPTTQVYDYKVSNTIQTLTCSIKVDFYNQAPVAGNQISVQQNKGTTVFNYPILQNWTDPNSADIPFLKVVSVTNVSCASAVINPDYSLKIIMASSTFVGTCTLPYIVSDQDLDNPLLANSTINGLLIAIVTNPPVAVADYIYVNQGSGQLVIPIATLLGNDYSIDIGSQIEFKNLFCNAGDCLQTFTVSGSNIIWPNANHQSCDGDAFRYTINTVGAPTFTSTAKVTIVVQNCVCTNVAIDLMFLLDGSGSISSSEWKVARQFVANVTTQFDVGSGSSQTRVGCLQFSSAGSLRTHIEIYSSAGASQTGVYNTLIGISQISSGTGTLYGFQQAMSALSAVDSLFPTRKSVAKVIVIITDGQPNDPCNCACCDCLSQFGCSGSRSPCSTINGTFQRGCDFNTGRGLFCLPCASPITYTNYINNLKISNNNSNANYKIVSLGVGDQLLAFDSLGFNIVKAMNYDPNLALQVSWSNLNLAVQSIVDAACSS
jgi:large repetitive protein